MLNCAAIRWASKRQDSVALSSCEAEIMAASDASKEAVYLQRFVAELSIIDPSPISLSVDNKGAVDLAYNPEHHKRTKHIERRHFFVREAVERGEIRVPFVRTDDNLADFFTKPLPSMLGGSMVILWWGPNSHLTLHVTSTHFNIHHPTRNLTCSNEQKAPRPCGRRQFYAANGPRRANSHTEGTNRRFSAPPSSP